AGIGGFRMLGRSEGEAIDGGAGGSAVTVHVAGSAATAPASDAVPPSGTSIPAMNGEGGAAESVPTSGSPAGQVRLLGGSGSGVGISSNAAGAPSGGSGVGGNGSGNGGTQGGAGTAGGAASTPLTYPQPWADLEPSKSGKPADVEPVPIGIQASRERGTCTNPQATAPIDMHSSPTCRASDLGALDSDDVRFMTFNAAQGHTCSEAELKTVCGGDENYFRRDAQWKKTAKTMRQAGSSIIAMQENYRNNPRSDNKNTALETLAQVDPSLSVFLKGKEGRDYVVAPHGTLCPPRGDKPCLKERADGTFWYQTPDGGTLILGNSTLAKKREEGFWGSVGRMAMNHLPIWGNKSDRERSRDGDQDTNPYGNATYLPPGHTLVNAYTEAFDPSFDPDTYVPGGSLKPNARNRQNELSREHADAFKFKRDGKEEVGVEHRAALVTITRDPQGRERAVINVHLSTVGKAREKELEHLRAIAAYERSRGREVAVMGDFNADAKEVVPVLTKGTGLALASGNDIDMIYTTEASRVKEGVDVQTGGGTDHARSSVTTLD
ncbi:MAG: hypothetical protein KC417_17495, partial [Myxococcales bacterium]|nr:hypothetical protein [Myxococcales bacterium]